MWKANLWLGAMAVLLAVPTWLTLRGDRTTFVDAADAPLLFAGFTPENVYGIRIEVPRLGPDGEPVEGPQGEAEREALTLVRADVDDPRAWVLGGEDERLAGLPVSFERVRDRVLEPLGAIRVAEDTLVREDAGPEALARYRLDVGRATVLRCVDAQGTVVADLRVGADASRGQVGEGAVRGYFVRKADSGDVVLFERAVWTLPAAREQWIQRAPLRVGAEEVVGIAVSNPLTRRDDDLPRGRLRIGRGDPEDPVWAVREGPPKRDVVRNGEVFAFLQTLARFRIQQYVEPLPEAGSGDRDTFLAEYGLADPRLVLDLERAAGEPLHIEVGDKVWRDGAEQNERYARISGVPFLVTVGDWVLAPLERDPVSSWLEPPRER